jgi:hypothetical protein
VNIAPALIAHCARLVDVQPPMHEQLLEKLVGWYPVGHVVPHCEKLVMPIVISHVAWFVDVHPPMHEQLLDTLVGW